MKFLGRISKVRARTGQTHTDTQTDETKRSTTATFVGAK